MKRSLIGGAALALALVLTGCTDSGAPAPTEPTEGADSGTVEQFTVNVAALPIAETGAIWAGIDEGIFEKHGLTLNIVPSAGGAKAVPSLVSGEIDFAIGSPVSAIRANLAGEDIRIIGDYADGNPLGERDPNSVVASEESGATSWKDLEGKKVGTNSPGAHGNLTILSAVEKDGGDPSKVEFVIVADGFPAMPAMLESGALDAAWMPDPFRVMSVEAGGVELGYPWQDGGLVGVSGLSNLTTQKVLDEKPQMAKQWVEAIDEVTEFANANHDKVFASVAENLDVPVEAAEQMTISTFNGETNVENLKDLIDLGTHFGAEAPFGFWDESPDLDVMVVDIR